MCRTKIAFRKKSKPISEHILHMSTINVQIHLSRGNFYHKLELHKSLAEALPAPTILHDFQKHISSLVSADVQVEIIIKVYFYLYVAINSYRSCVNCKKGCEWEYFWWIYWKLFCKITNDALQGIKSNRLSNDHEESNYTFSSSWG